MLVKLDHFPKVRGEHEKYLKPPSRKQQGFTYGQETRNTSDDTGLGDGCGGPFLFEWKMTFPTARSLVVPWSVGRWTFGIQFWIMFQQKFHQQLRKKVLCMCIHPGVFTSKPCPKHLTIQLDCVIRKMFWHLSWLDPFFDQFLNISHTTVDGRNPAPVDR